MRATKLSNISKYVNWVIQDSERCSLEVVKDNTSTLDDVCRRLVDLALSNKSQDNVSVLIICIGKTTN